MGVGVSKLRRLGGEESLGRTIRCGGLAITQRTQFSDMASLDRSRKGAANF